MDLPIQPSSEQACYHFAPLPTNNDTLIADLSVHLIDWVYCATRDIEAISEMSEAYRTHFGSDLLAELRQDQNSINPSRRQARHVSLSLILAHFMQSVAGEGVKCVSFRSTGVHAAYVFAGALTMKRYLETFCSFAHAVSFPSFESDCSTRCPSSPDAQTMTQNVDTLVFNQPRCPIVRSIRDLEFYSGANAVQLRATYLGGALERNAHHDTDEPYCGLDRRIIVIGAPPESVASSNTPDAQGHRPMYPMEVIVPLAMLV